MRLDIRLPIGLMFAITGAVLAIYGLFSDSSIYTRSLGINVNLWWGLVIFAFGAIMLVLVLLAKRKETAPSAGITEKSKAEAGSIAQLK
jgi:hypothetical protein